jgi:polysaccharide biosynthesis/export protein
MSKNVCIAVAALCSLVPGLSAEQPEASTQMPPQNVARAAAPAAGAAASATASTPPAAPADYVIGPQDVLSITVFDQADLSGKYPVELDGSFTFPLVGRISAGGLSVRQFETMLRAKLADGYFKNPQITVSIDQYKSQRIFIIGEVRAPGAYALDRKLTLIEALAKAGSTTPSASDEVLVVRSHGSTGPVLPGEASAKDVQKFNLKELQSGTLTQNPGLDDGDTIYVSRAELVYIFGQIRNPGSYPILRDTTVLQALSLAGGVTPNGAMGRIKILRMVNGEKKEVKVKLTDKVQPDDTIVVPERYF